MQVAFKMTSIPAKRVVVKKKKERGLTLEEIMSSFNERVANATGPLNECVEHVVVPEVHADISMQDSKDTLTSSSDVVDTSVFSSNRSVKGEKGLFKQQDLIIKSPFIEKKENDTVSERVDWGKKVQSRLDFSKSKSVPALLDIDSLIAPLVKNSPSAESKIAGGKKGKKKKTEAQICNESLPRPESRFHSTPIKNEKARKRRTVEFVHPVPEWMSSPGPRSEDIIQSLGSAAVTFHNVPHSYWLRELGHALPDFDDARRVRDGVWRDAFNAQGVDHMGFPLGGIIIVSIDPGTINFAIRVERRKMNGDCTTLYSNVFNLDPYSEFEARTTGAANRQGEQNVTAFLESQFFGHPLREWLEGAHVIMIEQQLRDNTKANRVEMFALGLLTALLTLQKDFTAPLVMETHSKLKNFVIEVPGEVALKTSPKLSERGVSEHDTVLAPRIDGLTRHFLKKSGISTARKYLLKHKDVRGLYLIDSARDGKMVNFKRQKKTFLPVEKDGSGVAGVGAERWRCDEEDVPKTKIDDLTDTVCHIEAWRELIGWSDKM
jgi:hypothetical protein